MRIIGRRAGRIVGRLVHSALAIVLGVSIVAALLVVILPPGGNMPWVPLDLAAPAGPFTGRRLAALAGEPASCRRLLVKAGIAFRALPPHDPDLACRFEDGVRLATGGSLEARLQPPGVPLACPLAAALAMWEWDVVQPAALDLYGARVVTIDHYGSYSCRRLYGRATGDWSEHARANAIDVAGFRLADGRRITVAADWRNGGRDAAFLHRVRDGACRLFATVLSPDYNVAHRDHLHLDEAARGAWGWRACR